MMPITPGSVIFFRATGKSAEQMLELLEAAPAQ